MPPLSTNLSLVDLVDAIANLLLQRERLVFPGPASPSEPVDSAAVDELEAQLLALGFLVSRELGAALRAVSAPTLASLGAGVLKTLGAELGGDRTHVPLFRSFPRRMLESTRSLYVRRVMTCLLQNPEQPCLWCGELRTVRALDPCGHLVCSNCWDGSDYSACPICYRRLSPSDPFIKPRPRRVVATADPPFTCKLLHLGADLPSAAALLLQRLLGRATPLSPQDRGDLELLLTVFGPALLPMLPPQIPVKETAALLFGTLLRHPETVTATLEAAAPYLRNATDVLRVLSVWMGGEADLLNKPPKPLRSPSRTLRRGLLAALERCAPHLLAEDILRHPGLWKRLGARLHPFEFHRQFPNTALAFAVLRRSEPAADDGLRKTVDRAAAGHPDNFQAVGEALRFRGWGSHLERALRDGELERALQLLGQRPGELLRRLDHLLRKICEVHPELLARVAPLLRGATDKVSPALLLTVLAHLRARTAPLQRRVFFPRGNILKAFALTDTRPALPGETVAPVQDELERELLRRAGVRPPFAAALLDAGLADLIVPFNERTAARALIAVPRGSSLPIPADQRVRLFVHWTEPDDQRVDLDLSVAMFDADWRYLGLCDFTELEFGDGAAVHSGDLTSAPPPLGASEFVDLDAEQLERAGARHLVVVVFSYNDIAFDLLPDAFAGFMLLGAAEGEHYDPRAVAHRFDLQGDAEVAVPLIVDLAARRMRWVDAKMPAHGGGYHDIARHCGGLAHLGLDFTAHFGSGARMSMWELACLHAAARCPVVHVRRADGSVAVYRRGADEPTRIFFHRLVDLAAPDDPDAPLPTAPTWFALLRDDLDLPAGSEGYALRCDRLSATQVTRLAAADLVAALAIT